MDRYIVRHILKHKYVYALLALAAIAYGRWLFTFDIFSTGDWGFQFSETARSYLQASIWDTLIGFGGPDAWSWRLPLNIMYGLFGLANLDKNVAEKFIVFWPTIITGIVASYALTKKFFGELPAFFGALVFNFNSYYLASSTHFLLYSSESFGVAALYFYIVGLEKLRLRYFLSAAAFLIITAVYDVRGFYMVLFIMVAYAFYMHVLVKQRLQRFGKLIYLNIVFVVAIVGLLLYWLLGTYTSGSLLENDVLARNLFGDSFWSLQASLSLFHPFWAGMSTEWFVVHAVPVYFWVIPLAALGGLYFKRHDRRVLFFAALALLGIFLAKQSDEPFSSTYLWLYNNLPGFNAFREATKFYFFIVLGYTMLVAALIHHLKTVRPFKKRHVQLIMGGIALALIINLVPLVSGTLNSMHRAKHMPNDYTVLNNYLKDNSEGYRTLWVPRSSKWGIYTTATPKVEASEILSKQPYRDLFTTQNHADNHIESLLTDPAHTLFTTNIKYVIVPSHDAANGDDIFASYEEGRQYYINTLDRLDFLKPINIGAKGLRVYENTLAQPYINSKSALYSIDNTDVLATLPPSPQGDRTLYGLKLSPSKQSELGSGAMNTLFDTYQRRDNSLTEEIEAGPGAYVAVKAPGRKLSYTLHDHQLTVRQEASGQLFQNEQPLTPPATTEVLANTRIAEGSYYATLGDAITPLEISQAAHPLGDSQQPVYIQRSLRQNLLGNPSFDKSLWAERVEDCNPYDRNANIKMYRSSDAERSYYVALYARQHTACSSHAPITVQSSTTYHFTFDYKSTNTNYVGYKLSFNDPAQTTIEKKLEANGKGWSTFARAVTVPEGATQLTITAMGFPGTTYGTAGFSYFDNFALEPLETVAEIPAPEASTKTLPITTGSSTFSYRNSFTSTKNLISNSSFEEGSWQKHVSDCNNYDTKPDIAATLDSHAVEGKKSLRLEAARHTACVSQNNIPVINNTTYLLTFKYKADNAKQLRYRLVFNDAAKTVIDRTEETTKDWSGISQPISVPLGASQASLTVYATPNEFGPKRSSISYDAFSLTQMSPALGTYTVVTPPRQITEKLPEVTAKPISPTEKEVTITSAKQPFYIEMHETFDKKWRLDGAQAAISHVETADMMNAWHINPQKLCQATAETCQKNNDGSYTIRVTITYTAQKYFYVGLIISMLSFMGIVGWLMYETKKR